jgi:hypothetical protein
MHAVPALCGARANGVDLMHVLIVGGLQTMHTFNLTARLLTLASLAIVTAAIITSSLHVTRAVYGTRRIAQTTKKLTEAQTEFQGSFATVWQRLKGKSEAQIKDNDKRISTFKTQRVRASKIFRETYDRRVAELERRNAALKGGLVDYKGDRGVQRRSPNK